MVHIFFTIYILTNLQLTNIYYIYIYIYFLFCYISCVMLLLIFSSYIDIYYTYIVYNISSYLCYSSGCITIFGSWFIEAKQLHTYIYGYEHALFYSSHTISIVYIHIIFRSVPFKTFNRKHPLQKHKKENTKP